MARDSTRVYVGDLGSGGSKPELEREFERYGSLKSVWVARNPPGKALIHCRIWSHKFIWPVFLLMAEKMAAYAGYGAAILLAH